MAKAEKKPEANADDARAVRAWERAQRELADRTRVAVICKHGVAMDICGCGEVED